MVVRTAPAVSMMISCAVYMTLCIVSPSDRESPWLKPGIHKAFIHFSAGILYVIRTLARGEGRNHICLITLVGVSLFT